MLLCRVYHFIPVLLAALGIDPIVHHSHTDAKQDECNRHKDGEKQRPGHRCTPPSEPRIAFRASVPTVATNPIPRSTKLAIRTKPAIAPRMCMADTPNKGEEPGQTYFAGQHFHF